MIRKKGTVPTPTTTTLPRLFLLLLFNVLSAFNCTLGLISGFVGQYFNQRPVFIACVCMRIDPAMITKNGIVIIFSGSFQTSPPATFGNGFNFFITQHHSLSLILIMVDICSHHLSFTLILVVVADSHWPDVVIYFWPVIEVLWLWLLFRGWIEQYTMDWDMERELDMIDFEYCMFDFMQEDMRTFKTLLSRGRSILVFLPSFLCFGLECFLLVPAFNCIMGCALIYGLFSHHYLVLFFLVVGLVSGLAYAEPCGSFAFTLSFSYYLFLFLCLFLFSFLFNFNFIFAFGLSSGVFCFWMHVLFYFSFFLLLLSDWDCFLLLVPGCVFYFIFYFYFYLYFYFGFIFVFILFLFCFAGGFFGRFVNLISFWLCLEWNVDLLDWSFIYIYNCLWYWMLWTWLLFRGRIKQYTMYWDMERVLDLIDLGYRMIDFVREDMRTIYPSLARSLNFDQTNFFLCFGFECFFVCLVMVYI